MYQIARNLSDAEDGFLRGKKYLLMDRDAKFCEAFHITLEQVGTEAVRLPPRSLFWPIFTQSAITRPLTTD